MKKILISWAIKLGLGAIAIGIGIWYLSSSIGGASLTYTNMSNFLNVIGASDGNVANVNGCFLCGYIQDLFSVIGNAAENFWFLIINNLWLVMAVGLGLFIIVSAFNMLLETSKKTVDLTNTSVPTLDFKTWFDKVWKQTVRVLIVGVLIGVLGMGGTTALKTISNITITPVMFVGSELSMAATGVINGGKCDVNTANTTERSDILNPILKPFMCVVGNLNTVMLAGASGGFALMNYSWLGLGAGILTWVAGLALVIMFLIIGFNLLFEIISIIFKLVFLIIFLPLLLAAAAFEPVWQLAKGITDKSIDMLVGSAVKIIAISLKISVIFGVVYFAADMNFPGPQDKYTSILPPIFGNNTNDMDAQTTSVMNVFSECEQVSLLNNEIDKDKFITCFNARKTVVENEYPGAFDFMGNGWDFLILMIGIFFLYYWVISPKIDAMLVSTDTKSEVFAFGNWIKDLGKTAWKKPREIFESVYDRYQQSA